MSIKILMPALSPTMKEGILQKWLVKVGDKVKAGDLLAEIETDKATMEVEAVDEGTITNILVKEGTEGVAVNSPIAILNGSENEEKENIQNSNKANISSEKMLTMKSLLKDISSLESNKKELKRFEAKVLNARKAYSKKIPYISFSLCEKIS